MTYTVGYIFINHDHIRTPFWRKFLNCLMKKRVIFTPIFCWPSNLALFNFFVPFLIQGYHRNASLTLTKDLFPGADLASGNSIDFLRVILGLASCSCVFVLPWNSTYFSGRSWPVPDLFQIILATQEKKTVLFADLGPSHAISKWSRWEGKLIAPPSWSRPRQVERQLH